MTELKKLDMKSVDVTSENIEKIGALFPNCITESQDENGNLRKAINFEVLQQLLSKDLVEGKERYEFTWPGKKQAILDANVSISKTLRPCVEESKDWENTKNLYIEGDNLEALKLLQKSYFGKVKMIYIDPPYNTGNDFIYEDDFSVSSDEYNDEIGQQDDDGNRLFKKNSDSDGRFHSKWCSMIYSRLLLARNLLSEDGVIYISIDDNELDNSLKLANDIFGRNHYIACFPRVTKKAGKSTDSIAKNHDYVLVYAKSNSPKFYLPSHTDEGYKFCDEYESLRGKYKLNQTLDYDSLQYSPSLDYPIVIGNEIFYPGNSYDKYLERKKGKHGRADWAWRWSKDLFDFGLKNGFIVVKKYDCYSRIYTKTYQNCRIVKHCDNFEIEYINRTKPISTLDFVENEFSNDNAKKDLGQLFENCVFDYSKPLSLLTSLISYSTKSDDLIIDFFSGSATSAQATFSCNFSDLSKRRFIMIQLPDKCEESSIAMDNGFSNICEIGKERIRRSGELLKKENSCSTVDVGFRVLKVDSSNMKNVYYNPKDLNLDLLASLETNIKEDRTDLDLLFASILDFGLTLDCPIKEEVIDGAKVYIYNDDEEEGPDLIACFADNISEDVITYIAKRHPTKAVFKDSSFESSPSKINLFEIFKMYANISDDKELQELVRVI